MQNQSSPKSWQHTKIFSRLEHSASSAGSLLNTIRQIMPLIEKVLSQGGTSPTRFTLHDDNHAFRVAEKMVDITPTEVFEELSEYELAFLLLSAYLHDIGMTPERKRVTSHYEYLLCGDSSGLRDEEVIEFQRWLDQSGRDIIPPLTKEIPTSSVLRMAEEIVTYYCRHKHNDWSEDWIRKHLSGMRLGNYTSWVDDLVILCRSHHYGYHELRSDSFDPRVVDEPCVTVHVRFLACVLRIADILEFDPERTPDVIFQHRNVAEGSAIYWWKDHHIKLVIEGSRVALFANPPTAYIHKAIEVMVDDINFELAVCRKLADEKHFDLCPGLNRKLPHRWGLDGQAYTEITPNKNSYVYIDGAFRPNTKKLLELLSGEELYGSELVAVREVLQNAFDAVREQIAYQRLLQSDPGDSGLERILGELHCVSLKVDQCASGLWLICSDTGVGMTLPIIKDHFLVSGSPRRFDVIELERKCNAKGFGLSRTGQFGIGVLSYFLLADRVLLRTRRSQEPGDSEPSGWQFETEGVGSFGELRKNNKQPNGTDVHLHLRSEIIGSDPSRWYRKLYQYVSSILQNVPCRFELTTTLPDCEFFIRRSGWIHTQAKFTDNLVREMLDRHPTTISETNEEYLPTPKRLLKERKQKDLEEVREKINSCIHWIIEEGKLPDSLGSYRIHIPYFSLDGGNSLAFSDIQRAGTGYIVREHGAGYIGVPNNPPSIAWKGIHVSLRRSRPRDVDDLLHNHFSRGHAAVEIDLHSSEAGMIDVSRHSLSPGKQIRRLVKWINQKSAEMYETFRRDNEKSLYCFLNNKIGVRTGHRSGGRASWIDFRFLKSGEIAKWKFIQFPAISSRHGFRYREMPKLPPRWNGQVVSVVPHLPRIGQGDGNHYSGFPWYGPEFRPDRIVEMVDPRFKLSPSKDSSGHGGRQRFPQMLLTPKIVPLWTKEARESDLPHIIGATSKFPPAWSNLCGVEFHDYSGTGDTHIIWNPDNLLIQAVDVEGWHWATEAFREIINPLGVKQELLESKGRAIAWIIHVLSKQKNDLWDWLKETSPDFLEELLEVVFGDTNPSGKRIRDGAIYQWVQDEGDSRLRVLTASGWGIYRSGKQMRMIRKYMPSQGSEWIIERQDEFLTVRKRP